MSQMVQPLLVLIGYSLLPSLYLKPLWVNLLLGVLLGYRFWLDRTRRPMPPRGLMIITQLVSAAAVWIYFEQFFGGDAGGALLSVLLVLKTFELRTRRDFFVSVVLTSLVMMSHALVEQGLSLTLHLLFGLVLTMAFLYSLELEAFAWKNWRLAFRPTLRIGLQALPLIAISFLLFPRFSTGFGTNPNSMKGKTGVDDKLEPGSVAQLIPSDELMFRATFLQGGMPLMSELYWRGAVLDVSTGMNWSRSAAGDSGDLSVAIGDPAVEVFLEMGSDKLLFTPEGALLARFSDDLNSRRVRTRAGGIFELRSPLQVRERYLVELKDEITREAKPPPSWLEVEPASAELRRWLRPLQGRSTPYILRKLLENFRTKGFQYTLEPVRSEDMDDFLFRKKSGFCEHYAGTLATLLRHLQIPARVVVGFQGGTASVLGNYVTVRGHDAHAWVEYYDATNGVWQRVDPTAQVAPSRLAQGSASYLNDNQSLLPGWVPVRWVRSYFQLRAVVDEVDASWTSFLLGFDLGWQRSLLAKLGMDGAMFRALPVFLVLSLLLMLSILYFFQAQRREILRPEEKLYRKLVKILKGHGVVKFANEGPQTLRLKVAQQRPDLLESLDLALRPLTQLRYGGDELVPEVRHQILTALKTLRGMRRLRR